MDKKNRPAFLELYEHHKSIDDASLEFNERPRISYSLRPKYKSRKKRSLFAMVDIIDDNPEKKVATGLLLRRNGHGPG